MKNVTTREMLQGILEFDTSVPIPKWEFGYWYDTLMRWYSEGMPKIHPPSHVDGRAQFIGAEVCAGGSDFANRPTADYDAHVHFGLDERIQAMPINMSVLPPYPYKVLEEDEENMVTQEDDGKLVKIRKDGTSMPMFLEYPVKNRDGFIRFSQRFDANTPGRFATAEEYQKYYKDRQFPLILNGGRTCGFFSILRECLGVEGAIYGLYDQPDLMHEILTFFTDYYIEIYKRALAIVEVDFLLIWEDMCFKNGPLISPKQFAEFCVPYYRKLINEMKRLGVKHFVVDTDGNCDALTPLFIDVGVTGIYPYEVAAGMDIEKTRAEYSDLVIIGGIDKRALTAGKAAIDNEVHKVERMLKKGGYLPCVDHAVPPDVSLENYTYFRSQMDALLERGR